MGSRACIDTHGQDDHPGDPDVGDGEEPVIEEGGADNGLLAEGHSPQDDFTVRLCSGTLLCFEGSRGDLQERFREGIVEEPVSSAALAHSESWRQLTPSTNAAWLTVLAPIDPDVTENHFR